VSDKAAERAAKLFDRKSGTPEQIIAWLREYEEAGMGYAIIYFGDTAFDRSSLELFAKEVIPAFR
jgi:alkanesulfonate monooxygenase SsuD/methylene tetrahydromethanopterin reductase-like flavin-dependent oxidoreductase (luciferase family)